LSGWKNRKTGDSLTKEAKREVRPGAVNLHSPALQTRTVAGPGRRTTEARTFCVGLAALAGPSRSLLSPFICPPKHFSRVASGATVLLGWRPAMAVNILPRTYSTSMINDRPSSGTNFQLHTSGIVMLRSQRKKIKKSNSSAWSPLPAPSP
jgi:hypothetical protein